MNPRAIILRETLVSIAINMVISLAFFVAIFGFGAPAAMPALGRDFFLQAFMVALMGSLVPSLLLRARIGGAIGGVVLRAFGIALVAAIPAGGAGFLLCRASSVTMLDPGIAAAIKVAFGGLVALATTPVAVAAVLRAAPERKA